MSAMQRLEFSGLEEKQSDNDILGAHAILKIVLVDSRFVFFNYFG